MNKEKYGIQDFLADPEFKEWVLHHRHHETRETFKQEYPHKSIEFERARQILLTLAVSTKQSSPEMERQDWDSILGQMDSTVDHKVRPIYRQRWFVAAAVVLLALGFLLRPYVFPKEGEQTYQTKAGQAETFVLPDSSKVLLLGNSRLRFRPSWDGQTVREVWIEGHAYFDVRHLRKENGNVKPSDRFVVHTDAHGQIEVLGTSFSVSSMTDQVRVHLDQGSIRFSVGQEQVLLAPGEAVVLSDSRLQLQHSPTIRTLWNKKELVLHGAALYEVLSIYHQVFDSRIRLSPSIDSAQTLDGTIPFDQPAHVVEALSALLGQPLQLESSNKAE